MYDTNCNIIEGGILYVRIYGNIIFVLHSLVTLMCLVLITMFYIMILKYHQNRESRYNNTLHRALILIVVLCISVIAKLSQTIANLEHLGFINKQINAFYYELIDELIQTIVGTMLPLGFAVYLFSPNKLKLASLKNAAREWLGCKWTCSHCCCCRANNTNFDIFVSSNQYFTPNIATYSTSYTNEFIKIVEMTEHQTVSQYGTVHQS